VCVFWQLCGCFGNMCNCIYTAFVLLLLCIFILFCYLFKDYCHRVKTQLLWIIIIIIIRRRRNEKFSLTTIELFRFKINFFIPITLLPRNKYSFYANWYSVTSDDTTNLHSQCRCTPQHRIWLKHMP
jgi:hypothetical protein